VSKIKISIFEGLLPRAAPNLLGASQAQTAENAYIWGGTVLPFDEPNEIQDLQSDTVSVFPYNGNWLEWATDVDVVKSPVAEDLYDRIYYTGDGVPKVRGILDGNEVEYTLGIPAPASPPTVEAVDALETTWTRTWYYFYEEEDGTVSQEGDLTEGEYGGETVFQQSQLSVFKIETLPAKTTATDDANFMMWFQAYSETGVYLGACYPSNSVYAANTDFYLNGARVTGKIGYPASGDPSARLRLSFDTSRASDYTADRTYVLTYVSAFGEEGPPSDPSTVVAIQPTEDCQLTNIPGAPTGDYNITNIRVYRTVTGTSGTSYFFITELDIGTTSYLDTTLDADVNEILPSVDWEGPPDDLTGLIECTNGVMAGFVGKTVYFSEPNRPHAWPDDYAKTIDEDIVAIAYTLNQVIVLTTGHPHFITGNDPLYMSVDRSNSRQACSAKRSVVTFGDIAAALVIYASPDGLIAVNGANSQVLTTSFYSKKQWKALDPATMIAKAHDNRYHCWFTDGTALIFDPSAGGRALVTTDQLATGGHANLEDDTLYLIQDGKLTAWNQGSNPLTATWRSKQFLYARTGSFSVAQVKAEGYPVIFRIYAEEDLVWTHTFTSERAKRIPVKRDERRWSVEVESQYEIIEITMSTSMRDL